MSFRLIADATYISRWDDARVEIETPCLIDLHSGRIEAVYASKIITGAMTKLDGIWVRLGLRELPIAGATGLEQVVDVQALRGAFTEQMGFGLDFDSFQALQDNPQANTQISFRSWSDANRDSGSVVLKGTITTTQMKVISEQLLEGFGLVPAAGSIASTVRSTQALAHVSLTLQRPTLSLHIDKVVDDLAQVDKLEITPVRYA